MDAPTDLLEPPPYRAYAGVGSRETPPEILEIMRRVGQSLAQQGWTLRSGAAQGADSAFEDGCRLVEGARMEIYLPWKGFSGRESGNGNFLVPADIRPLAEAEAEWAHPSWRYLKHGAKMLHTRNACQVLGMDLDSPAKFVLCWTAGGTGKGGTGLAIRLAKRHNIPVFDLAHEASLLRVAQAFGPF